MGSKSQDQDGIIDQNINDSIEQLEDHLNKSDDTGPVRILEKGLLAFPFLLTFTVIGLVAATAVGLVTTPIVYITFPTTLFVFVMIGAYFNRKQKRRRKSAQPAG